MELRRAIALLLLICAQAAAIAASAALEWQPVGLSGGGGLFSPAISAADPNLMMVNCDMGAAYLSRDGGRNWRMIHHMQLRSDTDCRPAFHQVDRRIIYASSGGQLRKSVDGGDTFKAIGNLDEPLQGEIRINPRNPDMILVGTGKGRCYLSIDSGETWKQCDGPTGKVLGFHFDRTRQGKTIFAATEQGIWRSDDAGGNWVNKSANLPSARVQGFAAGSDPNGIILYCSIPSENLNGKWSGGIYRSYDRGETWELPRGAGLNQDVKKADQWGHSSVAQYHQLLTTDARPQTVYAFNTSTGFHPPHHETVFRSDDAGDSWRATYFQDPRFKEFNVEPDYVLASTGQSFKGGGTPFGVAICDSDPERVMLVITEAHVTHDGGKTWLNGSTYRVPGSPAQPGAQWICNGQVITTTWNYYIDPFEPARHYIAYTDIGFARSLDAGKSWIWWDKKSWAPWRNTCYEMAFDPEVPGLIWGAFSDVHDIPNDNIISERHGSKGPGGICVSRDFGASWKTEAQGLPLKAVTSVVIDPKSPKDSRVLYAGVFEAGVFKSVDSGKSWAPKNASLGHSANMRVSKVSLHRDGTLFAVICAKRPARGAPLMLEGVGLYRSRDGAENWEKINLTEWRYVKDFSVDPRDSNRILIGVCDSGGGDQSGGLYATRDGGRNWSRIGRKGSQTFGGYFHPRNKQWIYMTLTEGAPGAGLWFSPDDGKTWTAFDEVPFSNIQRVSFDPKNDQIMYVTTFGGSVWKGPSTPAGFSE
jgi:photosystem II stability/assembly factor-like uncharacterized protein